MIVLNLLKAMEIIKRRHKMKYPCIRGLTVLNNYDIVSKKDGIFLLGKRISVPNSIMTEHELE